LKAAIFQPRFNVEGGLAQQTLKGLSHDMKLPPNNSKTCRSPY
jgi:hypothetical protein